MLTATALALPLLPPESRRDATPERKKPKMPPPEEADCEGCEGPTARGGSACCCLAPSGVAGLLALAAREPALDGPSKSKRSAAWSLT